MSLICIFLMNANVEHFSINLLATCVTSKKELFTSFAYFLGCLLPCYWVEFLMDWILTAYQIYGLKFFSFWFPIFLFHSIYVSPLVCKAFHLSILLFVVFTSGVISQKITSQTLIFFLILNFPLIFSSIFKLLHLRFMYVCMYACHLWVDFCRWHEI